MIINDISLNQKISQSSQCSEIIRRILNMRAEEDQHKEMFYVIGLDSLNRIVFLDLVAIGTVNSCVPAVRECYR